MCKCNVVNVLEEVTRLVEPELKVPWRATRCGVIGYQPSWKSSPYDITGGRVHLDVWRLITLQLGARHGTFKQYDIIYVYFFNLFWKYLHFSFFHFISWMSQSEWSHMMKHAKENASASSVAPCLLVFQWRWTPGAAAVSGAERRRRRPRTQLQEQPGVSSSSSPQTPEDQNAEGQDQSPTRPLPPGRTAVFLFN